MSQAGLNWSVIGSEVVIPLIEAKHLEAKLQYGTLFGEQQPVELLPGEYFITCVGYAHGSNSRDPAEDVTQGVP